MNKKIRLEWIDVLRALAILLVVYGHRITYLKNDVDGFWFYEAYSVFLNPIKMPLFFALSGYLFRIRQGGDIAFFKKTFTSLVIPWLVLGLVPLIISVPFNGLTHAFESIVELFTGVLLWFMPCFIIAQIIFYYVIKLTKNHLPLTIIILVVISAIGYMLRQRDIMILFTDNVGKNGLFNIFMINIAMMVQFYFLIGYLYKKYEDRLRPYRLWFGITLLVCYIIIGWITYPGGSTDVHNGAFYCLPVAVSMTVLGLLALFLLSSCIKKYPNFLLLVGKNSLVIYMLDRYVLMPFLLLFNFKSPYILNLYINKIPSTYILTLFIAFIYLFYSSTINILIAKVLNKYLPWATGGRG